MKEDIQQIIAQMTLEEKASLCSGRDFWSLKSIERLGIPAIMVTDGPHGLRKQASNVDQIALNASVPATCFPTASATASSWDRDLLREIGQALGEECLQEDVAVILGPGANIKRSPLCGRNFEYFSEDPYLAGEMAAAMIAGVQSQGVGTSLKHFAVNNQETRRMTIDARVDERALREIYLAGFEQAVKKAQPWTVMCAYNRLNGPYCSEDERLLNKILREEWGFEGLVVTDWGACNDRVAGLKAGQELEMPGNGGLNDAKIVAAAKSGALDLAVLDRAVERLLTLIFTAAEKRQPGYRYDQPAHHALARRAAGESLVLLKNDGAILPLKADAKIALIGAFAKQPRYQGSGSSLINPAQLDNAYAEFSKVSSSFSYAAGYDPNIDTPDDVLIAEACAQAREAEVAIIFAGLPDTYETEAIDRTHMRMPESHNQLIQKVAAANPNTVVVLSNGAPVEMPWAGAVKAILEGFLGGEAGGSAAVDGLFGKVNPSGKLSETYPLKLEDVPSTQYFPSGPKTVEYRESLYVGYRYFDTARQPVLFPFGHGLSYTTFAYSELELSSERISDQAELNVSLTVKNTGPVAGAEVVQLYVSDLKSVAFRPAKELKGFAKLFLQPGEEQRVEFTLNRRSFAYYNPAIADWHVESGVFSILVGASSADIRARGGVWVESSRPDAPLLDLHQSAPVYYRLPPAQVGINESAFRALYGADLPENRILPGEDYTINTPLGDLRETFVGRQLFAVVMSNARKSFGEGGSETMQNMAEKMMADMPLRNMVVFSNGMFTQGMVDGLLLMMNRKTGAGLVKLIGSLVKKK
jgi:beta-glucosidase